MSSINLQGLGAFRVWDKESAFQHLNQLKLVETKHAAEQRLYELEILPPEINVSSIRDENGRSPILIVLNWEIEEARKRQRTVLFIQCKDLPDGNPCLYANDVQGTRYWVPISTVSAETLIDALGRLQIHIGKPLVFFPHGTVTSWCRSLLPKTNISFGLLGYQSNFVLSDGAVRRKGKEKLPSLDMGHLDWLEAESIHIMREAVAEADNPVMLYSIGKDSSVMLHLARKAFFPARLPFPLLHVDTRWKFQEMYRFRDAVANEDGITLVTYINPEAIAKDINPFDHGSALHTDITKTEGLKKVLDEYRYDVVFGGARRDEEKSRAKERIFSFRTAAHRWDPKNQRPELWNIYNTEKSRGESIRVFPLSNWTELDIWQYIYRENIPLVPLYFAKERPVIERDGLLLMVDDERMRFLPNEKIQRRKVRFRTLGCYPLTGAVDSNAETVADIILELLRASTSERQGRAIDTDASASMERKKQEGYF